MGPYDDVDFAALERFCRGESTDAYRVFGCHLRPDGLRRFTVWAPNAAHIWLEGDFSGWQGIPMERLDCGAWTVTAENVLPGQNYRYAVEDRNIHCVRKSDPYAFHWETAPRNSSKVWDLGGYAWRDADFLARRRAQDPLRAPISIYEVHLGSWRAGAPGAEFPNYRDLADALAAYCTEMGYTHVELLPVTEYPYEPSWGYQVTGYFAPTSRYGTPQDFMYFVDTLHAAGVGVIMDWVPAHFPRDEYALAYFDGTPTYERDDAVMAAHPDWGTLIFDYEKPAVRSFLKSSVGLFLREYHIDGFRVDAVSSMLYLGFGRGENYRRNRFGGEIDLGAAELLREINGFISGEGALAIAEESSAYPGVTRPAAEGGLGFRFKWDMGFMHDTLDYMTLDPLWRKGSHGRLTFSMMYAFSERFILAFSHDEVVHGKKSMLGRMPGFYDEKFANLRALYGYIFGHPGKKLGFMGGEFGQFIEWDYRKELDWFLLDYPRHSQMREWYRALNFFYRGHPALWEQDDGWEGFRWLNVDDADRSSLAFLRVSRGGERIVAVCNFTPVEQELRVALPGRGRLTRLLSSDEGRFGGTDGGAPAAVRSEEVPFLELRQSALLRLPPLSCSYCLFEEDSV